MREKNTSVTEVRIIITSALAWAAAIIRFSFHQQTLDRGNCSSFRNANYHSLYLLQCLGCIQGSPSQRGEANCCFFRNQGKVTPKITTRQLL